MMLEKKPRDWLGIWALNWYELLVSMSLETTRSTLKQRLWIEEPMCLLLPPRFLPEKIKLAQMSLYCTRFGETRLIRTERGLTPNTKLAISRFVFGDIMAKNDVRCFILFLYYIIRAN